MTASSPPGFAALPIDLSGLATDLTMPLLKQLLADKPVVITVDGPAAVGKGTAAQRLASRLGLSVLDTGKMYRAAALLAIEAGIPPSDHRSLVQLVRDARISFDWHNDPPVVIARGIPLGHRIRTPQVDDVVSAYAGVQALRDVLIEEQRRLALEHPRIVCDGRDQGSIVFPNADVKFYLDASEATRAKRDANRHGVTLDEAALAQRIARIKARDDHDRRNHALQVPADAVLVRTDDLTPDAVLAAMEHAIAERLAPGALSGQ